MIIKTLLLITLFSLSVTAYSGDRRGNGGDGFLINDSPVVFDLIEAGVDDKPFFDSSVETNPLLLDLVKKNLPKFPEIHERLAQKLTEIERISSPFAWAIAESFRFFNLKVVNAALVDIKDEDSVVDYDPSKLVQLAIRRAGNILINGTWWPKMPVDQKVVLLVHEVIYAFQKTIDLKTLIGVTPAGKAVYETRKGQESVSARAITGFLFTEDLKTATKMNLIQLTHEKNTLQYLVETLYDFNEEITFIKRTIDPYINKSDLRTGKLYYFNPYPFEFIEAISEDSPKKISRICKSSGAQEMSGISIMMNPNPDLGLHVSGPMIKSLYDLVSSLDFDGVLFKDKCPDYIAKKILELK